jgi:hypothetical protein
MTHRRSPLSSSPRLVYGHFTCMAGLKLLLSSAVVKAVLFYAAPSQFDRRQLLVPGHLHRYVLMVVYRADRS